MKKTFDTHQVNAKEVVIKVNCALQCHATQPVWGRNPSAKNLADAAVSVVREARSPLPPRSVRPALLPSRILPSHAPPAGRRPRRSLTAGLRAPLLADRRRAPRRACCTSRTRSSGAPRSTTRSATPPAQSCATWCVPCSTRSIPAAPPPAVTLTSLAGFSDSGTPVLVRTHSVGGGAWGWGDAAANYSG